MTSFYIRQVIWGCVFIFENYGNVVTDHIESISKGFRTNLIYTQRFVSLSAKDPMTVWLLL
jgi:hypothetical protein